MARRKNEKLERQIANRGRIVQVAAIAGFVAMVKIDNFHGPWIWYGIMIGLAGGARREDIKWLLKRWLK